MKNTFGNSIALTLFGESHGAMIGAVLDGLAPGMEVSEERIREELTKRRPSGAIATARVEEDPFQIVSGVFEGKTTGTPLTILIPNQNTRSRDYNQTKDLARPGHADYTAHLKYHGYEDYRGGGHFSGRLTAALVAAGAVLLPALEKKGIRIGSHIQALGATGYSENGGKDFIEDQAFSTDAETLCQEIEIIRTHTFPTISLEAAEKMVKRILTAKDAKDSVGGILETAVVGLPGGVGEPWFDTVEGLLSHALFSVPGVKGVEFGNAFQMVAVPGSVYNDAFRKDPDTGAVITKTNHNAGINGGITNGMPIVFRAAVKPTPSIFQPQETINMASGENAVMELSGRHDPAIIHRAKVVTDSVTAITIADLLAIRYGTDWIAE